MKANDKVVLNPKIKMTRDSELALGLEYVVSEVVADGMVKLHGFENVLFDESLLIPRPEHDFYYAFNDYHNFIQTMKAYLNTVPAGFLREEAARNIKPFWDFVDISYQRTLPEGSSLRTRTDRELKDTEIEY